jgi:hypothetical protein
MKDKPFRIPVIVDTGSHADRDVKSLREALDVLATEWPADRRGPAYAEAVRSCRAALDGLLPVEQRFCNRRAWRRECESDHALKLRAIRPSTE